MSDMFYRAFEERNYAPRKVISQLRKQYLPFVKPIAELYPGAKAFDIGCGRGEWLEIANSVGLDAQGVDLDAGMLADCLELGLNVERGDAVAYLSSLDDESCAVVSAFHVVEHISFEQLREVVAEALRVLKPGGVLIMETPNPENISVGTSNFYLDPTHVRPIPSGLLMFLTDYAGFARSKLLRLQEPSHVRHTSAPTLFDVLSHCSPDYAVVAQKNADEPVMELIDAPFRAEYGVGLQSLAERYHERLTRRLGDIEASLKEAELRAVQAEHQIMQLLQSRSWRLTAPIRFASERARAVRDTYRSEGAGFVGRWLRARLSRLTYGLNRLPLLKRILLRMLTPFPRLKAFLRHRVLGSGSSASRRLSTAPAELSAYAGTLHKRLLHSGAEQDKEKH
ncbi:class I SAM-dependent methyltransferase [Marinobacterium sp. AK62]|uniref:Class I SAM-dependent methyltransferase n=1 Tax=Marinobacterium alkalitolerans TaxID=1542925 RepID=A0ABS3ZDF9_9GAMM|nr:class I SAM-dependent methyltransferase [Marinobacterium alkalitolerans]MBP0049719.1 class I SAM-dependent methyltransferase [Marinobacterium alkalitolerans]